MQPSFVLLTLHALSVLVAPGPDDGCPSSRQISAALATRAPAAQRIRGPEPERALTLTLPAPGSAQEPSFSLVDEQGRLRLFRTLARPGSAHARDCVALSVTVALIVQRYLEEVELPEAEAAAKTPAVRLPEPAARPVPAPVSPEPRTLDRARLDLSFGLSMRIPNQMSGLEPFGLRLGVARTFGRHRDTGLLGTAWAGISGWTDLKWAPVPTGNGKDYLARGTVIRVPMGLGLMWRRTVSAVELQLGAGGLLDWWILDATYPTYKDGVSGSEGKWKYKFAVSGALLAGLQVPLGKRLFVRVAAEFGVAAVRYEYSDPFNTSDPNAVLFSTPSVFGDAGLALGMSLR